MDSGTPVKYSNIPCFLLEISFKKFDLSALSLIIHAMILDLQEHILKRLPRNARAGTARLLNRQFATLFEDEVTIYANDADLPDEVLHRWYFTQTNPSVRVMGLRVRAGAGDLRHVQWLRAQDPPCPWDEYTCEYAALGGHLEVLKWLRTQDHPWRSNMRMYEAAAERGHLEVLMWLREQDPQCPWSMRMCESAAERGHLKVLQWLRVQEPPCPYDPPRPYPWDDGYICECAARGGHMEMLKWLCAQDFPLNESTCAGAAYGGHLQVLMWLRSQNPPCPWDEETCFHACVGGHLEVLTWLRTQYPPCPWNVDDIFGEVDVTEEMRAWILAHM